MKLLYIPMYIALLCIMACNKSGAPSKGKLKKSYDENTERYNDYQYDAAGRLSSANYSGMTGNTEILFYYNDNRISEILVTNKYPTQTGISEHRHMKLFKYEDLERLSEIVMNYDGGPVPPGNITRYEFVYTDETKKFSTCKIYLEEAGAEVYKWKIDFMYDARGNISQYRHYHLNNNQWESHEGKRYSYTMLNNPYYLTGDPTDFDNYYSRDFWTERTSLGYPGFEPLTVTRSYRSEFFNKVVYSNVPNGVATHYEYY